LVTSAYRNSFFNSKDYNIHGVALASARAGNVIGGGDWAEDRLIPDFIRSISNEEEVKIRSPYAIRPWQHVLEPLTGYLILAEKLYADGPGYAEAWNFGPDDTDAKNVGWITKRFSELWGNDFSYIIDKNPQPHEASSLKLDCSKAKARLEWNPKWNLEKALETTVEWYKTWLAGKDIRSFTENQIDHYLLCDS
jgi:CDP-glucose 4,6-dehydratase